MTDEEDESDTGYLLGFTSKNIVSRSEYSTKLGGCPLYPSQLSAPEIPSCAICNGHQSLVLQAYAPARSDHITETAVERALYIFCCNRASCSGNSTAWTAIRVGWREGKKCVDDTAHVAGEVMLGTKKEGEELQDLEAYMGDEGDIDMELLLKLRNAKISEAPRLRARKRRGKKTKRTATDNSNLMKKPVNKLDLKETFLDVSPEPSSASLVWMKDRVQRMLQKYDAQSQDGIKDDFSEQGFTKVENDGDAVGIEGMSNFVERIERAPYQCVRYKFRGKPLWRLPEMNERSIPACPRCASPRVFELQLLGSALYYLKPDAGRDPSDEGGMTWSSVALYVCREDCWNRLTENITSDVAFEKVLVEPDEW